ncbi:MAG TPA: hypothetical protein VFQ65_22005 [Kofleriaceae bacterium]|nr:hypothetical protein [Kofleriaceae bacterium]
MRERVERLFTERVILVAGWVWFLVYGYPGYMSYDSSFELSQARHIEKMNDWHPPVFSLLWRYTDAIIAGPFPMLVIQSILFVIGVRALLRGLLPGRAGAVVTIAILLAPQTVVIMGVIWKDALMAGCLASGIACLFTQRRSWRVTGYVLIFLATAVRYNSAAATLPIVLAQFGWKGALPRWRRLALASALWVGIALGAFLLNNHFVEEHKYPWQVSVAMLDITGVIRFAPHLDNEQLLADTPGVPWHKTDKIQIRARTWYSPRWSNFLTLTNEPGQIFDYPTTDEQIAGMTKAWKKLVAAHPLAYVHHRLAVFYAQLQIDDQLVWGGFIEPMYVDVLGHRAVHSPVQEKWLEAMSWLEGTFVFRTSFYFILALLLLPLCRGDRLAQVLIASGLVYELALLVAAPAIGYRYSHWLVECTLIALVMVFVRRYRASGAAVASARR